MIRLGLAGPVGETHRDQVGEVIFQRPFNWAGDGAMPAECWRRAAPAPQVTSPPTISCSALSAWMAVGKPAYGTVWMINSSAYNLERALSQGLRKIRS